MCALANSAESSSSNSSNEAELELAGEILLALDDMSVLLCQVLDVAELCRNVHPVQAWREAADGAYNRYPKRFGAFARPGAHTSHAHRDVRVLM